MAISSEDTASRKWKSRSRQDATLSVAETLARWEERNAQLEFYNNEIKSVCKAPGTRSKKGCMKGKGGPENSSCKYRGVRQRTWGNWVAEIREPKGKKMWLGSFENSVDAALSYDKAARALYGSRTRLNFLNDCSATTTPSSICLTITLKNSGFTNYSEDISMKLVTPNLRNEGGEDEWSSNTLHATVTKAVVVATPTSTQQVEKVNDKWSPEEIDTLLETNSIHDIESMLGHDAGLFWFSTIESMNDMAADAFLSF